VLVLCQNQSRTISTIVERQANESRNLWILLLQPIHAYNLGREHSSCQDSWTVSAFSFFALLFLSCLF
jgi:hypothetical protein